MLCHYIVFILHTKKQKPCFLSGSTNFIEYVPHPAAGSVQEGQGVWSASSPGCHGVKSCLPSLSSLSARVSWSLFLPVHTLPQGGEFQVHQKVAAGAVYQATVTLQAAREGEVSSQSEMENTKKTVH